MTAEQKVTLERELKQSRALWLHHGDCKGSDAQAHKIAFDLGIKICIHPPSKRTERAYATGASKTMPAKPYIERNHAIVSDTLLLIATPDTAAEKLRSGTWATIRYARLRGRPIIIINPDGSCSLEN
jgi:hypothetical protein